MTQAVSVTLHIDAAMLNRQRRILNVWINETIRHNNPHAAETLEGLEHMIDAIADALTVQAEVQGMITVTLSRAEIDAIGEAIDRANEDLAEWEDRVANAVTSSAARQERVGIAVVAEQLEVARQAWRKMQEAQG